MDDWIPGSLLLSTAYRATTEGYTCTEYSTDSIEYVCTYLCLHTVGSWWAHVVARRKSDQSLPVDFHHFSAHFSVPFFVRSMVGVSEPPPLGDGSGFSDSFSFSLDFFFPFSFFFLSVSFP